MSELTHIYDALNSKDRLFLMNYISELKCVNKALTDRVVELSKEVSNNQWEIASRLGRLQDGR